ncbi:MAG TPA: hypothetical protein VM940_05175 [Chthoniobacterales bacterium]|nr:hypothetical protein [Chthoniobacterales bacterium]
MRAIVAGLVIASLSTAQVIAEPARDAISELIPWLLREKGELREIPFSQVIFAATGKRVLALDSKNEADQILIRRITAVLDEVLAAMNDPDSAVQRVPRINEASSHFENLLREKLGAAEGLQCDFPRTTAGRIQRSGYPDLRIVEVTSNRVVYLDPKLYAAGSRESGFRTFYFEPKVATNKVTDDAVHLIVGFEHEKQDAGHWNFTRWDLVDLAHFKVRLKAEFQASNHDIYKPGAVVATSGN